MKHSGISAILIANTLVAGYIDLRQYLKLGAPMPAIAKQLCTEEEYKKSVAYNRTKRIFSIISNTLSVLRDILIFYMLPIIFKRYLSKYSNANTLMLVFNFLLTMIVELPFSFVYDFVIEAMYGFNKKTVFTFISDAIKTSILTVIISYPLSSIALRIINRYTNFYLYLWVFFCTFQFGFMVLFPTVIAPLYNKFVLMENGELKTKIEELAKKVGFSASQILIMDGSKRSGHSNAYFTGFGKAKKIVFYDTILNQLPQNEVLAVLCHELGHWACSHTYLLMSMAFVNTFILLFSMNYFIVHESSDVPLSLRIIEFTYFSNCLMLPLNLLQNFIVRCFERQADRFAVKMGYGDDLHAALIKINNENKGTLVNDPIYSTLNYSHPPLLKRLDLIEKESKKIAIKNE